MRADSGDQGEDGLRGLRAPGPEGGGRDERGVPGGGEPEAEQAHGGRLRRPEEGPPPAPAPHREGGRVLALRPLQHRRPPLRPGHLRQEGPSRVREERAPPGPAGLVPRPGQLLRGQVHLRLQRREPERLLGHVMKNAHVS